MAPDQQTVGSYVDDAAITTAVKAKMAEDKSVSAAAISVETLNGTVQLSGFAKSQAEKDRAESIARNTQACARRGATASSCGLDVNNPLSGCAASPFSHRCALREGGRHQRGGAALARWLWLGLRRVS